MSNDTKTNKRPTHTAYSVRDYQKNGEKQSDWMRIGGAWQHSDGDGLDIILDAYPVNGRVVLRKSKPKPAQA